MFGLGWNSTSTTKVEWYFSPIPKVHCSFNTNHGKIQLTINLSSVRNILIHSLDTLEVEVQLQDFLRSTKSQDSTNFITFFTCSSSQSLISTHIVKQQCLSKSNAEKKVGVNFELKFCSQKQNKQFSSPFQYFCFPFIRTFIALCVLIFL